MKDASQNSKDDTQKLTKRDEEIETWNLKKLFAEAFVRIEKRQAQVTFWDAELTSMRSAASWSITTFDAMTWNYVSLPSEFDALKAVVKRWKGAIQGFAESVRPVCNELMCAQAATNCNWLDAELSESELRGEYVGEYRIRISNEMNSLRFHDMAMDEGRKYPSSQKGGDDDITELIVPLSNSSLSAQ